MDRLFCSVAQVLGQRALAVVLTGMGADGAEGAREVARVGGEVWAESEETAVVFGMPGEAIATAQDIPGRFLESILAELRRSGIIASQRGSDGGYWLARPAAEVSVADVIRAVEGPLADVHGAPPEEVVYEGAAVELQRVWIATRVALRVEAFELALEVDAPDLTDDLSLLRRKAPGQHRPLPVDTERRVDSSGTDAESFRECLDRGPTIT